MTIIDSKEFVSNQRKYFDLAINEQVYIRRGRSMYHLVHTPAGSESEFNLYDSLDRAFADVKLMMDGKKRKKTAQEFLEEIRNGK